MIRHFHIRAIALPMVLWCIAFLAGLVVLTGGLVRGWIESESLAERKFVARQSQGFVYYVSLTGITGAKLLNVADVGKNVEKIRKVTQVPVAVGFGVATPEDAANVAAIADGVIVGSAIVKQIAAHQQKPDMVKQVAEFVRSLKTAMNASLAKVR